MNSCREGKKLMISNNYAVSLDVKIITIDFLRKQKNGLIIGEYRNILFCIYNTIKTLSDCCYERKLSEIRKHNAILESYPPGILLLYCRDLEKLGYITINEAKDDYELFIDKEIDF